MMDAETLMYYYKNVVQKEENINDGLGLITNPNAQKGGILLVGMNPSGEGQDIYCYLKCHSRFWNPKHKMMGDYDAKCGYIDLLPIRDPVQDTIIKRIKADEDFRRYCGKLLAFTRDYIELLRPRLIIIANKDAWFFWGFSKWKWMGYTFKDIDIAPESRRELDRGRWPLVQICDIEPTDVNRHSTTTNLDGTYIVGYRQEGGRAGSIPKEQKLNIKKIVEFIDSKLPFEWEKTLYDSSKPQCPTERCPNKVGCRFCQCKFSPNCQTKNECPNFKSNVLSCSN